MAYITTQPDSRTSGPEHLTLTLIQDLGPVLLVICSRSLHRQEFGHEISDQGSDEETTSHIVQGFLRSQQNTVILNVDGTKILSSLLANIIGSKIGLVSHAANIKSWRSSLLIWYY